MKRVKPQPGQESVWDYPRPPAIEPVRLHIKVIVAEVCIYDHNASFRILETSHPPTYYLPLDRFINCEVIETSRTSFCEWKGQANYYHIKVGDRLINYPAWGYKSPNSKYRQIRDHISIYADAMEGCYIDDEKVQPQEGDFYGGWITSRVVGP